jgi:GT2 family glycosyltransferase
MSDPVSVSIILVNHNGSKLIRDCLSSVYEKTKQIDYEVIVVDNASSDESAQIVRSEFPHAHVIECGMNLGFSAGNNLGSRSAVGEYLLFLNPDTVLIENSIKALKDFLDVHPHAGAVGPRMAFADGAFQLSAGQLPNLFVEVRGKAVYAIARMWRGGVAPLLDWMHRKMRVVGWLTGACLMVRREAFQQVGGFDEDLFMYFEDKDLCKRLGEADWKVVYYPGTTVVHLLGGSAGPDSKSHLEQIYRESQVRYYEKHLGGLQAGLLQLYLRIVGKA